MTKTLPIKTPENRKVLYYLKGQNFNNVVKITSIDEVVEREYEVTFDSSDITLNTVFEQGNKIDLKTALNYLTQMTEGLRLMHDAEEPVAVDNLCLSDFILDDGEVKFSALDKLIWAEPEYVALNIKSYLEIVRSLLPMINFEGERNVEHLKGLPDLRFRTMDLIKLELQRIHKSCFRPYNPNLPVGFRSGIVKNNVIGLFSYFIALNIALRFDFSEYTVSNIAICRLILFTILVIGIFIFGNYKDVLDIVKINKIRNKNIKYVISFLISFIVVSILLAVFLYLLG